MTFKESLQKFISDNSIIGFNNELIDDAINKIYSNGKCNFLEIITDFKNSYKRHTLRRERDKFPRNQHKVFTFNCILAKRSHRISKILHNDIS
jgi:hypothetical protein